MKNQSETLKRFNYLNSEINALYHTAATKLGLSDSTMSILYTICEQGDGCNQSDIYKLSGLSRQTVNSAIHKLKREHLVYLEAGEGRNTRVFLTDSGKLVMKEKVQPLVMSENELFAAWSEQEQQELLRLTKKYLDDFKKKVDSMAALDS